MTPVANEIMALATFCLAQNVYFEARGESIRGQYLVAMTTLNRANYDPNQVCGVVFKPKQFSWTKQRRGLRIHDVNAWGWAHHVAQHSWTHKDETRGSTHYHATYIPKPDWAYKMEPTIRVGQHQFYCCEKQK